MIADLEDRHPGQSPAPSGPHRSAGAEGPLVVYFSSVSENTHRFAAKLRHRTLRLPLHTRETTPLLSEPYVLMLPTYGRPTGAGAVPPQVVAFLNRAENRAQLRGVIGAGNTNFGDHFCLAARKVSAKCNVPLLYTLELMGTEDDVHRVDEGLDQLWQHCK